MLFNDIFYLYTLIFVSCFCDKYPIYEASGTYYQVGYQIGQQARDRIIQFIDTNPDIPTVREYISTNNGSQYFSTLLSYNSALYPNYFDELRGLSDGSGVNYTDILLINFEYELDALISMNNNNNNTLSRRSIDACSDLFVYNENVFIGHGHNEDDWNGSLNTAYFTNITYYDDDSNKNIINHIFGFNFVPAILPATSSPGISLFNSITLTINYLFPTIVTQSGRATVFVCRSILDSKNLTQAIEMIGNYGGNISVGASFNMGYIDKVNNKYKLMNVESYMNEYNALNIENKNFSYHFNAYLRLENIAQNQSLSSMNRYNRSLEMINNDFNGTLINKDQIIQILGDQNNTQSPIYRQSYMSTLTTSLYDLQNGIAYFYEQCNPKNCTPTLTIPL